LSFSLNANDSTALASMLRLPRTLYSTEHLVSGDAMRRFIAAEPTPRMQG